MAKLTKKLQSFSLQDNTLNRDVKSDPADRISLEIGDSKEPGQFMPQAKIKRWDNETNLSVRRMKARAGETIANVQSDRVTYEDDDETVHIYEKPEIGEDGGLEIELHLKQRPKSNRFDFSIRTKGLDFFYQPALTKEEIKRGAQRSENVVGSYAVYHKTARNDYNGGKSYKTGKFCHIYRPHITDAKGNEVWGELEIDVEAQTLTVIVPDSFLKKAVYPVIVDPTFGYTSVGASTEQLLYLPFTRVYRVGSGDYSLAQTQNIESISVYLRGDNDFSTPNAAVTANFTALINEIDSNATNSHGETVASDETNIDGVLEWKTLNVTTGSVLTSRNYVINIVGDIDSMSDPGGWPAFRVYSDTTANPRYSDSAGSSSSYPPSDPWSTVSPNTNSFSLYATYTAAAPGPSPLTADSGAYATTGQVVTLTYNPNTSIIPVDQGVYNVAGQTVGLTKTNPAKAKVALLKGVTPSNPNSTPAAIQWDSVQEYNDSVFDWVTGNNTRLVVKEAGDYLITANVPYQNSISRLQRLNVLVSVYVNGIRQDVGEGASGYIRDDSGHTESSSYVSAFLSGLSVNDYIEIYVEQEAVAGATAVATYTLYTEKLESSETVFAARGTQTVGGTNINQASDFRWDSEDRKDTGYTHTTNSETITLDSVGDYLVLVTIPQTSAVVRSNAGLRVQIGGTTVGEGKQGYIRNGGGHNTSSVHYAGVVQTTTTNQDLKILMSVDGAGGTVTVPGGTSGNIVVVKLPAKNIYYGKATQVGNQDDWAQTGAVENDVNWATDEIIDTSIYTHSTTTSNPEITVLEDGDYFFSFNVGFSATNARANTTVKVYVNGVAQSGFETKHAYIRLASGHNESSLVLSGLLSSISANDVIKLTARQEAASGLNDTTPAELLLWKKDGQPPTPTSQALVMAQGVYAATGQAVALKYNRTVSLASGNITYTGQSVIVLKTKLAPVSQGGFVLSGQAITFVRSYRVIFDSGPYSQTGNATGANYTRTVSIQNGSYTQTGQTSIVTRNRLLLVTAGNYNATGYQAGISNNRQLVASQVTYTLAGQATGLRVNRTTTAAAGIYTVTGYQAGISNNLLLVASQTSFTVTGSSTNFKRHLVFSVDAGTYTATGYQAGISNNSQVVASQASYTLAGQTVGLRLNTGAQLASRTYSLTGQGAVFYAQRTIQVVPNVYTYTGRDTVLRRGFNTAPEAQNYALGGFGVGLRVSRRTSPIQGAYALSGRVVVISDRDRATLDTGTFTTTGQAIALRYHRIIPATAGTYTQTGYHIGISQAALLLISQRDYAATGYTVALTVNRTTTATAGTYAVTGAVVGISKAAPFAADQAAYTYTGQQIATRRHYYIAPVAGTYTQTGAAIANQNARRVVATAGTYTATGVATPVLRGFIVSPIQGLTRVSGQGSIQYAQRYSPTDQGLYTYTGYLSDVFEYTGDCPPKFRPLPKPFTPGAVVFTDQANPFADMASPFTDQASPFSKNCG